MFIGNGSDASDKSPCTRRRIGLVALHEGSGVFDKVVDENRPGALLVIVRQVVVHRRRKVQQQVPGVLKSSINKKRLLKQSQ